MVCLHSFVTLSTTGRQFIEFVLGIKLLAKSLIEASSSLFADLRKNILFPETKISNAIVWRFGDFPWFNCHVNKRPAKRERKI